jgi:NADH-quinone oxidoreductase subunit C
MMNFESIVANLKAACPEVEAPKVDAGEPFVLVPAGKAFEVLRRLQQDAELHFDSLMDLAGADTGRELWVVYHLHSMKHLHRVNVKVVLNREKPECDSVVTLWGAANFFEREAYDLYGITFRNHPDLRRLLNPPDWVGWPGRKDYMFPKEYHGVQTERADQYFEEQIEAETAKRTT